MPQSGGRPPATAGDAPRTIALTPNVPRSSPAPCRRRRTWSQAHRSHPACRALSERAGACRAHLARERLEVVGAVVAAAVDEERRRAGDAAGIGLLDVLGDARRELAPA